MNKLNNINDFSFENNYSNEEKKKMKERNNKPEKILCNHCRRTATNGIRCLGICVADSDY